MATEVRRLLEQIRDTLPPPSMTDQQWQVAVSAVIDGVASPEEIAIVMARELLPARKTNLGYAPVYIALRRAGMDNATAFLNVLAYPPDETPPEHCLLWLTSAFSWRRIAAADIDAYSARTGLDLDEVKDRRSNGIEEALIAGDETALGLRQLVWSDMGSLWDVSPLVHRIATGMTVTTEVALELILTDPDNERRLAEAGIHDAIRGRAEWRLRDIAALIDQFTAEHGGHGTWSDPVRKRHSLSEMSGIKLTKPSSYTPVASNNTA